MKEKNNIIAPFNDKGQKHGLWEFYNQKDGSLDFKANFKEDQLHSYCEHYNYNSKLIGSDGMPILSKVFFL